MGYALVNKQGYVVVKSSLPILEVPLNHRISYRSDRSIESEKKLDIRRFHCMGCQGKIEPTILLKHYSIEVVGTNPITVERTIRVIEQFLGIKDVDLAKIVGEKELPELPGLPKLQSIWKRLKFLWNYIFHGQTV